MSDIAMAEPRHAAGADAQALQAELHAEAGRQQYLRFVLAGEQYAVRIEDVHEILELSRITPLPRVPTFVAGVMNIRGNVMPVFDLAARLGLPRITLGERSCIVVVAVGAGEQRAPLRLGLLVDAVYEVFDCPEPEQGAVPRLGTRISPQYLRSMLRCSGSVLPEIDVHSAFEPAMLAQMVLRGRPVH